MQTCVCMYVCVKPPRFTMLLNGPCMYIFHTPVACPLRN